MKSISLLIALCLITAYNYAQTYCSPVMSGGAYSCAYYGLHLISMDVIGVSGTTSDAAACDGSGYLDRTALSCSMNVGSSYSMTVTTGTTYPMSGQVWIDFSSDGNFDASESVGGFTGSTGAHVFNITLPSGTFTGSKRMRVATNDAYYGGAIYPAISPCGGYYYGEDRDYTVNVGISPVGYIAPTTLAFGPVTAGTTSSPLTAVFNGAYLTPASGNLTVTASSNFTVCSSAGGTYTSSYTMAYTGATVSAANIFVKFSPSASTSYTGTICVSGGGLSSTVCATLTGAGSTTLNLSQIAANAAFDIYPNPATDELTLTADEAKYNIEIANSTGVVVLRQVISNRQTRLNIKTLAPCVYDVKLTGEGISGVKRFVKL